MPELDDAFVLLLLREQSSLIVPSHRFRCFKGTASRIKGVELDVLAEESLRRHELGYPSRDIVRLPALPNPGDFHWRFGGELHMWNPDTIANLQLAARTNSKEDYRRFADFSNNEATRRATLRPDRYFLNEIS